MDRREKEEWIASLKQVFKEAALIVVTHYHGLTVAQMTDLRSKMRASGARFKVTKNRLTRRALEGTKYEGLSCMFTGPTAIAYSEDPVAAAKAAVSFSKENKKLIVLGGAIGDEQLDINKVKALAMLPSLDNLRAKIISMLQTPATLFAGILQSPAGQVVRSLGAYGQKGQEGA